MASSEKRIGKIETSNNAVSKRELEDKEDNRQWGHRFTEKQKEQAVLLIGSGMKREEIAKLFGASTESLRLWLNRAKDDGTMPKLAAAAQTNRAASGEQQSSKQNEPTDSSCGQKSLYALNDSASGLSEAEKQAIMELKRKHPSMGPAQIRTQLKRFRGWRLSRKAIARVLRDNGFELVHTGSRPKGEELKRFEAPHPNAMWQMDFAEMRLVAEKFYLLVALDDFSRFAVGHALCDSPSSEVAVRLLREAIARHGKPEAIRTDRAGAFLANTDQQDFARVLEAELIDHIVGRPYHPQGGGKVEALIGTIRRELWDVEHFYDRDEAQRRLFSFFEEYNHRRAHMGIDGVTPADRYYGRADQVLRTIGDISRRRQATAAQLPHDADIFEELAEKHPGAPVEVLRLMLCDDVMELRFCGARVRLGRIES